MNQSQNETTTRELINELVEEATGESFDPTSTTPTILANRNYDPTDMQGIEIVDSSEHTRLAELRTQGYTCYTVLVCRDAIGIYNYFHTIKFVMCKPNKAN